MGCEKSKGGRVGGSDVKGSWNKSDGDRIFFFFKQKTAYEIGTGDWSSGVCSSDLCAVLSFRPEPYHFSKSRQKFSTVPNSPASRYGIMHVVS